MLEKASTLICMPAHCLFMQLEFAKNDDNDNTSYTYTSNNIAAFLTYELDTIILIQCNANFQNHKRILAANLLVSINITSAPVQVSRSDEVIVIW